MPALASLTDVLGSAAPIVKAARFEKSVEQTEYDRTAAVAPNASSLIKQAFKAKT
jgi:hypothetical protein